MFTPTNAGISRAQVRTLASSLLLHGLLLAWVLYNPPLFLAPSSVAAGERGGTITQIYWPNHRYGDGPQAAVPSTENSHHRTAALSKLVWKKPARSTQTPTPQPSVSPSPGDAETQAAAAVPPNPAAPAGQSYGTALGGSTSGDEIRPALPLSATDPVVDGADLAGHGEGSVVVEITIDDKGNIVQKVVLESLGPAVDNKVLAALESWHFAPATRNGIAIPSKQDVHYHFKPTGQS